MISNETIVNLYLKTYSSIKVAKLLNLNINYVYKILKIEKINKVGHTRNKVPIVFNHSYFTNIDSEDKAYFLGLIAADGNITKGNRNGLSIALQEEDGYILQEFLNKIKSNTNTTLYKRKNKKHLDCTRIFLSSAKLKDDLIKLNVTPQKSLTLLPPPENLLPEYLIRHFLRGYYDGDGGISMHRPSKRKKCLQSAATLTGTLEMCEYFKEILLTYNFNPIITKRFKRGEKYGENNTYTLMINGNYNVIKFCEMIYQNTNLYIKRKYQRFLDIKEDYQKKHKEKYYLIASRGRANGTQSFLYQFTFQGKHYWKEGFRNYQEAAQACQLHLIDLNNTKALIKFQEINKEFLIATYF